MADDKPTATAFAPTVGASLVVILLAHSFMSDGWTFWRMIFQSLFNFMLGSGFIDLPNRRPYGQACFFSATLVFLIGFGTCFVNFNKH